MVCLFRSFGSFGFSVSVTTRDSDGDDDHRSGIVSKQLKRSSSLEPLLSSLRLHAHLTAGHRQNRFSAI